ncbi:MAG: pyruvate dehydrogenase (acetyl-transferring) E1 component subunit alpha [Desulforhabdus sp.]|nr:pyruvate dehydrogenase (acetyl-transferring) E1 component subunit alpha [Desulforhabdus sp.]
MPKTEIDLPYRVEYLSILDQHGEVDKNLEPDIPDELLLKLHRAMMMGRRLDERLLQLQRQGRMGTFAPIIGQEAAQIGAVATLEPSDWFVPAFREMAAELWRGKKIEHVILLYAGYNEGGEIHSDLNNLPVAIPVGSQILHAVGLSYAMKYRKKKEVAMVFFGDGATSQGDFHEALNFAGVFQTPTVFVCQNNHWAISLPRARQTRSKTLAQKALAYGAPGIQVDGNDVLAVYTAAKEAVERARAGGGPTMIECLTYRMSVHTTADDPKRYRKEEEVKEWLGRDALIRFQKYLKNKGLLSDDQLEALEEEIKEEIKTAVDETEKRMKELGNPLDMFEHLYAELPPYLREQRRELELELQEAGK